jgi:uncharacterized protein (UPF0332 family)
MGFNWEEYLHLAQFLQGQINVKCSKEAAYRSAVSRAYYAAFCFARNYARDNQNFSPTYRAEDHELIREHFKLIEMGRIARYLDHLRQWRNMCDYYDEITDKEVTNISNLPVSAIRRAQQVVNSLNKDQKTSIHT